MTEKWGSIRDECVGELTEGRFPEFSSLREVEWHGGWGRMMAEGNVEFLV